MDNKYKSIILFLTGCIGSRIAFALLAKYIFIDYLPYLGIISLIPIIGWLYIIFIGKRDTGIEVFGEKIWWKKLRIVHLVLYILFAFFAFNKNRCAWIILLADVFIGLVAFIMHHSLKWDFN